MDPTSMRAKTFAVEVDPENGCLTAFARADGVPVIPGGKIRSAVYDPLSAGLTEDTPVVISDVSVTDDTITLTKTPGHGAFKIHETWRLHADHLQWRVSVEKLSGPDRGIEIRFVLPNLAPTDPACKEWQVFSATHPDLTPLATDRSFVFGFHGTPLPFIAYVNESKNIGYSAVVPFDLPKPRLVFEHHMCDAASESCDIRLCHVGLKNSKRAVAALQLVPHQGDWRASLDWMAKTYSDYFEPAEPRVWDHAGRMFFHFFAEEPLIAAMKAKGLTWQELHFYMPHYGLYAPDEEAWPNLITMEYPHVEAQIRIEDPQHPGTMVSVKKIRDYIAMLRKHDVAVYMYINHQNAFIDFAQSQFPESIITRYDGSIHNNHVHNSLTLINSDPRLPWGKWIAEQGRKLVELYHEAEGIFVDNVGHWFFDYAHDDGVSMVGQRPVYAAYLAYLPQLQALRAHGRTHHMSFYGNGPYHVDIARYLDGIMTEGSMSNGLPYLGLKKPVVCCRPPAGILEHACQCCLKYGTIMDIQRSHIERPAEAAVTDAYLPFFRKLFVREWELTPHALRFDGDLDGNIYRTGNNTWIITLVRFGESILSTGNTRPAGEQVETGIAPEGAAIEGKTKGARNANSIRVALPGGRAIRHIAFEAKHTRRSIAPHPEDNPCRIEIPDFRGAAILEITAAD